MKKKLLFIMDIFPIGGISKSLLALFHELDDDEYDIDFMLMKKEGFLLPLLPENIHLLDEPIDKAYRNPHPKYVFQSFQMLPLREWLSWIKFSAMCSWGRLTGGLHKQIQTMDVYIAKHAAPIDKEYDAAIAYQGGRCIYYIAEHIRAKTKIGYVHTDYIQSEIDFMLKPTDCVYFPQMDYMVTVSESCLSSLKDQFPAIADRCAVIENICSVKTIRSMAEVGDSFDDIWDGYRLVTMGRIDINTKGLDYAIKACKCLVDQGYRFKWYFVGDGHEREKLEQMIAQHNLTETFILLGAKINPYPFIKDCDIYVQPSRYEGKSVALDEVKALSKPVVVTNFSTVFDQFADQKTALIAEMDPESIASKIALLMDDANLRKRLSENLLGEKVGNEEQVKLFEALIS